MDEFCSIELPENMTIGNIKHCETELFKSLSENKALRIDPKELRQIDSSGVQLLFFLLMEAKKQNMDVSWLGSNETLNTVARKLGFIQLLETTTEQDFK
jgi:ABC-type transporter Mla MlaB component